ncbi:MAG: TIGR03118 family protein, partial [Acidobacteriia bacterium]|nr:TIGR03118 family protein [Terriglobia bacterium]
MTHKLYAALMAGGVALLLPTVGFCDIDFNQTNILSDLPGVANQQDLTGNLINPWGIAFSAGSPVWISDNGTGLSTVYNGAGNTLLTVTIPPPTGQTFTAAPDGIIVNGNTSAFGGSHFIFSTEDGTISAWTSGGSAALEVDNYDNGTGAVYKGLASGVDGGRTLLYAANFRNGT